ncbi:hypothetical protein AB0J25_22055 [Streptomyces sp. NPDC049910]|uniref:hypothetical protein n=1 Tax=Streptomyces sp. NPDC049910 TaxID=3155278 RepID=UPI0034230A55
MAARITARSTTTAGVAVAALGLALMALFVSVEGGDPSILAGMLATPEAWDAEDVAAR